MSDPNSPISQLLESIKDGRPCVRGRLVEYFQLFSERLEEFRLDPGYSDRKFDEKVLDSIKQLIPARNELLTVFDTIAQYDNGANSAPVIHKFFESLIPYLKVHNCAKVAIMLESHGWHGDNLKFIVHEYFPLCVATFLKHERYDILAYLLNERYFVAANENHHQSSMESFGVFRSYLASLKHRNNRLGCNRVSVHADLIKQRCTDSGPTFDSMMQADFLLYLTDAISVIKENRQQKWWPETLVYKPLHDGTFEIFRRAESSKYFSRLGQVLGVKEKSDLNPFVEGLRKRSIYIPEWDFGPIDPLELMNYDNLCKFP